nr:Rib/alpha-like domain-containing protein [Corynebacterium sp. TAE3-ERU16]
MDESLNGGSVAPVTDARELTPVYPVTPAEPGQKASSPEPTFTSDSDRVPGTVSYSLDGERPGEAVVDPDTGVVTLTPTAADAGKTIGVVVTVTYADGSVDKSIAAFSVGGGDGDGDGDGNGTGDGDGGTPPGSTSSGGILGVLFGGSGEADTVGAPGLLPLLNISGFLALVVGLIHFLRTHVPGGLHLSVMSR